MRSYQNLVRVKIKFKVKINTWFLIVLVLVSVKNNNTDFLNLWRKCLKILILIFHICGRLKPFPHPAVCSSQGPCRCFCLRRVWLISARRTQPRITCSVPSCSAFRSRAWTSGACTAGTPKTATKNSPSSAREVQKSPVWLHSGVLFMLVLMYWYQPDRFLQQDKRVWTSETTWWTRAIISRLKGTTRVWAARAMKASQRCVWPPCVSVRRAASISARTLKSVASSPAWIPVLSQSL